MSLTAASKAHGRPFAATRLLRIAGWLVIVPLLAVVGARLLFWDGLSLLVGLNALTPILFLPAWPVVVLAAVLRRWALFAAAAVVVASHLVLALPELLAPTAVPAGADHAPRLRVFSANVRMGNKAIAGYAEEIRRSQSDIVVLQEASPVFLAALEERGVLSGLLHRVVIPRRDPFSMVVASRWPLRDNQILPVEGRPVLVRATVAGPGGDVRLLAVHTLAPKLGHLDEAENDMALVYRSIGRAHGPVMVVGDFNSTWGNRSFRRLLDLGLTDAAAARGAPFSMTWPRDRGFMPSLLRIDHVLTGNGAVVTRIRLGRGEGSDHRPLIADVALTGAARGAAPR